MTADAPRNMILLSSDFDRPLRLACASLDPFTAWLGAPELTSKCLSQQTEYESAYSKPLKERHNSLKAPER